MTAPNKARYLNYLLIFIICIPILIHIIMIYHYKSLIYLGKTTMMLLKRFDRIIKNQTGFDKIFLFIQQELVTL